MSKSHQIKSCIARFLTVLHRNTNFSPAKIRLAIFSNGLPSVISDWDTETGRTDVIDSNKGVHNNTPFFISSPFFWFNLFQLFDRQMNHSYQPYSGTGMGEINPHPPHTKSNFLH